jgi:hypothetical protein
MAFFDTLQHLLPRTKTWGVVVDRFLRQLLVGLTGIFDSFKALTVDFSIWGSLDPTTTTELAQWGDSFGTKSTPTNAQLEDLWAEDGGQSPKYIQDRLHAAGFTQLFIHEWWVPPLDITFDPGFENATTTGWTGIGAGLFSMAKAAGTRPGGSGSLIMQLIKVNDTNVYDIEAQRAGDLLVGERYTVSFWVSAQRASVGAYAYFKVGSTMIWTSTATTSDWERVSLTFTATHADYSFGYHTSTTGFDNCSFDDQSVVVAAAPIARDPQARLDAAAPYSSLLVNKITRATKDWTTLAGEPLAAAGEPDALAGNYDGYVFRRKEYVIPSNVDYHRYFFYIGGPTFPNIAAVPATQREELEDLLLRISPLKTWIVLLIRFT